MLLPLAAGVDRFWALPLPGPAAIAAVLGLAVFSTALAYIVFFRINATAGPTNVMLVTLLIPVTATALGTLVLGEALTANQIAGALIIASGPPRHRRTAAAPAPSRSSRQRLRLRISPRSASGWLCRRQRPSRPAAMIRTPLMVSVTVRPMRSARQPASRPPMRRGAGKRHAVEADDAAAPFVGHRLLQHGVGGVDAEQRRAAQQRQQQQRQRQACATRRTAPSAAPTASGAAVSRRSWRP